MWNMTSVIHWKQISFSFTWRHRLWFTPLRRYPCGHRLGLYNRRWSGKGFGGYARSSVREACSLSGWTGRPSFLHSRTVPFIIRRFGSFFNFSCAYYSCYAICVFCHICFSCFYLSGMAVDDVCGSVLVVKSGFFNKFPARGTVLGIAFTVVGWDCFTTSAYIPVDFIKLSCSSFCFWITYFLPCLKSYCSLLKLVVKTILSRCQVSFTTVTALRSPVTLLAMIFVPTLYASYFFLPACLATLPILIAIKAVSWEWDVLSDVAPSPSNWHFSR